VVNVVCGVVTINHIRSPDFKLASGRASWGHFFWLKTWLSRCENTFFPSIDVVGFMIVCRKVLVSIKMPIGCIACCAMC
jgi:hypothetical protein